jgi:hypothetical protein
MISIFSNNPNFLENSDFPEPLEPKIKIRFIFEDKIGFEL